MTTPSEAGALTEAEREACGGGRPDMAGRYLSGFRGISSAPRSLNISLNQVTGSVTRRRLMSDSLLDDLRALAEGLTCEWTNGATCEETCCVNGQIQHLIAKHETKPDASERDELAQFIYNFCADNPHAIDDDLADAILAAGWSRR